MQLHLAQWWRAQAFLGGQWDQTKRVIEVTSTGGIRLEKGGQYALLSPAAGIVPPLVSDVTEGYRLWGV